MLWIFIQKQAPVSFNENEDKEYVHKVVIWILKSQFQAESVTVFWSFVWICSLFSGLMLAWSGRPDRKHVRLANSTWL